MAASNFFKKRSSMIYERTGTWSRDEQGYLRMDTIPTYIYSDPSEQVLFDNTYFFIKQMFLTEVCGRALWDVCTVTFDTYHDSATSKPTHIAAITYVNRDFYSITVKIQLNYTDFAEICNTIKQITSEIIW